MLENFSFDIKVSVESLIWNDPYVFLNGEFESAIKNKGSDLKTLNPRCEVNFCAVAFSSTK